MNPYQTPSDLEQQTPTTPRVDRKYLVVRSGDVLPLFCVKTGVPITEQDLQHKQLTWCSPVVTLAPLTGLLLIPALFFRPKQCVLQVGLSPNVRNRYRNWWTIRIVAVVLLFLAVVVGAATDNEAVPMPIIPLIIAFFLLFLGNSPITVPKYRGGEFWIAGCSKKFLQRVDASRP